MANQLAWIVTQSHFEFSELGSGTAGVLVGAWLLVPSWATFASSHTYDAMALLAPEWTWGAGILALGVVQVAGVLAKEPRRLRLGAALGATALWAFVLAMFLMSNPASLSNVWAILFFVFNVRAFLRLLVTSQMHARNG